MPRHAVGFKVVSACVGVAIGPVTARAIELLLSSKAGWLRNVEPATGRLPGKEFHQICYDLFLSEI